MSYQRSEKVKSNLSQKIVMVGAKKSGKTALLRQFISGSFTDGYNSTIGVDFASKEEPVSGEKASVKLQVWDTAGQERFRTITSSYYRGSNLAVVTLDLSVSQGIDDARQFIEELSQHGAPAVYIVGTKNDLSRAEGLTDEAVRAFVQQAAQTLDLDVTYKATSAKNGEGVKKLFQDITDKLYERAPRVEEKAPMRPAWKRDEDPQKSSFFSNHPRATAVVGAVVGAAVLYGLVQSALMSAPLAIGLGCAVAALALLLVTLNARYDLVQSHQSSKRFKV